MKMKEGRLEDPWKCVMNDCSNILCFPENSSRLINSWEEQRASLRFLTLSIPSSLDRLLSARNSAPFFLLFLWIKKEREWNGLLFHFFILLLSFSCFYTFFSWRKAIHHDGGEQQQNPNSEGGGWFISPLCSTFFLSLSLSWFCRKEKEKKIRREKRMEEKKRDSLEALWN